jgi:signal transduction histidine kinase
LDERGLRALIDAGRSVVAERELEAIFDRLLHVARELTGARYAALGVLDDDRLQIADFITVGIDAHTREQIGNPPRGRGVLGTLISEPRPLRLDDVGDHPRSYGFPVGHPSMETFLGVPVVIRGEAWGNLYLTDKQGGSFTEADEEAAVVLAMWAAIAVENARLYRESERRRHRLERSVQALEATSEIARAVGGETQLGPVLELIAKRSRALVEAQGLAILLSDDADFVVAAIAGNVPRDIIGARVTADGSVAGRVVMTGRPERANSLSISLRFALGDLGVRASSGLFVPLTFRGRSVGVLEAFDRIGGPEFDDNDERILLSAAASAATAVSTAQTLERDMLQRTLRAAEDERRRWARELHDETLQGLGGLRVMLSSARRTQELAPLQSAVERAVEQIGTEIENLRVLITELRPASLDELGLEPAIQGLVARSQASHGFSVEAALELSYEARPDADRLDPELETVIYRVVQEALNNAGRHANAEVVRLEIIEREFDIRVAIRDDGDGFNQSKATSGFGLAGMRERVTLAGGSFELTTSREGTTVAAVLPVRRASLKDTA